MLDLIQEALLGVSLIADDVGELFQRLGGIQRGGVIAVTGKCLHGEPVRSSDIVGHILADLFQHVVVAAVHGLVVIGLILAVLVPVGVGDAGHFQTFRHHVQIANGTVSSNGLIEEAFAVVAEDRPHTAKGEARP